MSTYPLGRMPETAGFACSLVMPDAGILDGEPQLDLVTRTLQQLADKADLTRLCELHRVYQAG